MKLSDSDDMIDVSRERAMFEVTLESLIWLADISSDSVMVLVKIPLVISSDINLVCSDIKC